MKKAAIIGLLTLFALTTIVFAAPALSTSSKQEVTVQGLARQVRALQKEVKALRRTMRAADGGLYRMAQEANQRALGVQTQVQKLDNCLSRSLAVTRYGGFVDTDAATVFTDYDPDVLGFVPNIVSGAFGLPAALDVTNPGTSVSYYLAIVEPSCAGGFGIAERQEALDR